VKVIPRRSLVHLLPGTVGTLRASSRILLRWFTGQQIARLPIPSTLPVPKTTFKERREWTYAHEIEGLWWDFSRSLESRVRKSNHRHDQVIVERIPRL